MSNVGESYAKAKGWGGWLLSGRKLVRPRAILLSAYESALLSTLIEAEGRFVPRCNLAAAIAEVSNTKDPANMVSVTVAKINARVAGPGTRLIVARGVGYAAPLLDPTLAAPEGPSERRRLVEKLLKDELEATGPHARAVSLAIEKIYSEGEN